MKCNEGPGGDGEGGRPSVSLLSTATATAPSATILLIALANIILKYAIMPNQSNHSLREEKKGKKCIFSEFRVLVLIKRALVEEGNAPAKYLPTF